MGFQFLIGTLKTLTATVLPANASLFQFLIGTLKTLFPITLFASFSFVSIPDRYAKNGLKMASSYTQP